MKKIMFLVVLATSLVATVLVNAQSDGVNVSDVMDDSDLPPSLKRASGCIYTGDRNDICFDTFNGTFYTIYKCYYGGRTSCGYYP